MAFRINSSMNLLQIIIVVCFVSWAHALIQCEPNACVVVFCGTATPCNDRFVNGGGYCGCCDACHAQFGLHGNYYVVILLPMYTRHGNGERLTF